MVKYKLLEIEHNIGMLIRDQQLREDARLRKTQRKSREIELAAFRENQYNRIRGLPRPKNAGKNHWHFGMHLSESEKENLREGSRIRFWSGTDVSTETRRKMSESQILLKNDIWYGGVKYDGERKYC